MKRGVAGGFDPPVSLLEYLYQHGWKAARDSGGEEIAGLCPLHSESRPSFYVNRRKQVFYCHGCGRGGGLARLIGWLEGPRPVIRSHPGMAEMMEQTYDFYQWQLGQHPSAHAYLAGRGIRDRSVIQRMRIGYAPGACLRAYLTRLGHERQALRTRGLIDAQGRDRLFRCLTFPLLATGNLYGRSVTQDLFRHRFLPGGKGGLYGLSTVPPERMILVEGLFDLAALWQAGFDEAAAVLGSHLNPRQVTELYAWGPGTIYICFDRDRNGSGQLAARQLSFQLGRAGLEAFRVELPYGHDPASFFAAGAMPGDFQRFLREARP